VPTGASDADMPAPPQLDEVAPAPDTPTESAFLAEILGAPTEPAPPPADVYDPSPHPQDAVAPGEFPPPADAYDPSPHPQDAVAPGEFPPPADTYDPTPRARPPRPPPPKDEPAKPRGFFKRRK
jgi:hypothetical protein